MRICTWNVNGIRARHVEVQRLADEHQPDLLCLQEIKATSDQVPEPLTLLRNYASLWHGAPRGYSGVSLHVRRKGAADSGPNHKMFSHPSFDFEARIVEADIETAFGLMTIASVYVPNGGKDFGAKLRFLEALVVHADNRPKDRPYVICGDLNVAHTDADVHERFRKFGVVGQLPEERNTFTALLATGLRDVVRSMAPSDDQLFTWWPPWRQEKQKNRGWRIDYVLASETLKPQRFEVLREFGTSDHAPLLVDLA
ncbi:MAG: exodeoxyribonuclease III [Deltaproteobacteria bacterium]|nr:exodeoxyribonuclease III [Deltaproteobacteria bacterium]